MVKLICGSCRYYDECPYNMFLLDEDGDCDFYCPNKTWSRIGCLIISIPIVMFVGLLMYFLM